MSEAYISFYLKRNRIHVFADTLRGIGSPAFIRFLISEDGRSILMTPYYKKDFSSHRVSPEIYKGKKQLEVYSIRLCSVLQKMYGWGAEESYRIPGTIAHQQMVAVFSLDKAMKIGHTH